MKNLGPVWLVALPLDNSLLCQKGHRTASGGPPRSPRWSERRGKAVLGQDGPQDRAPLVQLLGQRLQPHGELRLGHQGVEERPGACGSPRRVSPRAALTTAPPLPDNAAEGVERRLAKGEMEEDL